MLRLISVFTSHALFQHSAPLSLRGECSANTVTVSIERDGKVLSSSEGKVQKNGRFTAVIDTPQASFSPCTIIVASGEDRVVLTDILFGELWIAGGQSNMELPNLDHIEYKSLRPRFSAAGIRAYQPTPIPLDDYALDEADFFGEGAWSSPDDEEFENASALASIFCTIISEEKGVPCGFLNINRGATRIESWLPLEALTEELAAYQKKIGRYPTEENWNTYTEEKIFLYKNFNQISACERRVSAPLYGVCTRGMLWFQGCSNCMEECKNGMYAKTLSLLRDVWREKYGIPGEKFPVLFSTLYPYIYENETIAHGRFNQALIELVRAEGENYFLVTNGDLSPVWAMHTKNHPVHSIHKYQLGERFAKVALASVYDTQARCDAALLSEVERHDSCLLLRFTGVRDSISFADGHVRGLYIAGEDGKYLPAEAEAVSADTLRVWHPAVKNPSQAAYAVVSNEIYCCSLKANGMSLAPFITAERKDWASITIEARPWCDLTRDYDFQYKSATDSYPRAIYKPTEGSGVCFDDINALGKRSLRIYSERKGGSFGACYDSRFGARLDFENYKALSACVFPARGLSPSVVLTFSDGSTKTIDGVRVGECEKPEWAEYRFAFEELPNMSITKFAFVGSVASGECAGMNIDRIYLIP